MGNCFKIYNSGEYFCYYGNTEQVTVNLGGGSDGSLGLGSVAGVLGIGGTVGNLANGIGIGGGTTHSISKTYTQQRVIAIPPHASRHLTEEKWIQTKKWELFSGSSEWMTVEDAESFSFRDTSIGLKRRMVKRGYIQSYDETSSPWRREYIITYSTDERFNTYSTLKAELFLHEVIGCKDFWDGECYNYIEGFDEFTIGGMHRPR